MTAGCRRKRILIESETKKLFLQEALFTTTMSKARVPKRKEEYVPPDEIKEFRKDILEAGRLLAVMNCPRFPKAEKVSEAIGAWDVGHLPSEQQQHKVCNNKRDS
jgi:hypothetical protein